MKASFSVLLTVCLLYGCIHEDQANKENFTFKSKKDYEETIIASHQLFLKKESNKIDHLIDSLGKSFIKTGTGLRYSIIQSTYGDSVKRGDVVQVQYLLRSIEGDTLYRTDPNQLQEFTVDYEDIESGLHEGIKYMKVGEKAILILPAHLGHGMTGDQAAIPSQTTLIYEIQLISKR